MERLNSIAALTTALLSISQPGDTIQLRPEDGEVKMLNEAKGIDPAAAAAAYHPHDEQLTVAGVIPSAWLINDARPLGELLYNYPNLKLVLAYSLDGQAISLNADSGIRVNIESETIRLKAGRFEDAYLELLFADQAPAVQDMLDAHGLKIKKLDTATQYISVIALEPRT